MTIVDFLTARYDEAESGIREALRTEDYGVSERDLADIAAKRRIVERYREGMATASDRDELDPNTNALLVMMLWPLFDLASAYADHPDYDPDWKV